MQYNPQIEIEILKLDEQGLEVADLNDEFVKLSSTINGQLVNDYNYHSTNKPLNVQININKQLGSTQGSCNVTIHNHPLIEKIRLNPVQVTQSLADNFYRVRIWAWHDDNGQVAKTARPNIPPAFVGDILDGFAIDTSDVVDSSISFQANSHTWLQSSGKMKKSWAVGVDYSVIVNDIFKWVLIERNYGYETFGAVQKSVIEAEFTLPALVAKKLKKAFTINRNPVETLNDICRDMDMVWGIDNNIPYIIERKRFFAANELNQIGLTYQPLIQANTGKIGVTSYGLFNLSASSLFDPAHVLGTLFVLRDNPQIDGQGVAARIDSMSITLDNEQGHKSDIELSWLLQGSAEIRLPRRNSNNSGSSIK